MQPLSRLSSPLQAPLLLFPIFFFLATYLSLFLSSLSAQNLRFAFTRASLAPRKPSRIEFDDTPLRFAKFSPLVIYAQPSYANQKRACTHLMYVCVCVYESSEEPKKTAPCLSHRVCDGQLFSYKGRATEKQNMQSAIRDFTFR